MFRVAAYIDGFNLYHGVKQRGWKQFYWFDPHVLIKILLDSDEKLVFTKYFTAVVRDKPGTPKGHSTPRSRQSTYLSALGAVSEVQIIRGKFYRKLKRCLSCQATWDHYEEKMTDSAIASHLVADAFRDKFDIAVLVGGDTDIIPAVKMVRRHVPTKRLVVWFPPSRVNLAVEEVCHDSGKINGFHLSQALMPDTIQIDNGVTITKPVEWV